MMKSINSTIAGILGIVMAIGMFSFIYLWLQGSFTQLTKQSEEQMESISKAIGNLKVVNAYFYEDKRGLVLDLRFDEGSGNIAHDYSGNGNDGELKNGPQWVDGVIGKALKFDGVDDYVVVKDSPLLRLINFTLISWIKMYSYPSGFIGSLISKGAAINDTPGYNINYAIGILGNQSVVFGGIVGSVAVGFENETGVDHGINTTFPIDLHKWVYILGGYDYNTGYYYIYLNSKEIIRTKNITCSQYPGSIQFDCTDGIPEKNYMLLSIGAQVQPTGNLVHIYKSIIDEVRIYNRALSPEEIKDLFFRIHLTLYNPTNTPIDLNNSNAFYVIEDLESGNTVCSIPLIYNKTFTTQSGKTIIYPQKQDTIKLALIYQNKVCHLEREHNYNVCLLYQGKKVCGIVRVV